MDKTEFKFGRVTEWLLQRGFELKFSFEDSPKGLVERISLVKGDEEIEGHYRNIEDSAAQYVEQQIRVAKSKVQKAEGEVKFWTYFAKQLGVISE